MDTTVADVVVRNTPTAAVAGASIFSSFPIAEAAQWAALVWITIQAGFYLYDRYRKYKDGRK